MQQIIEDAVGYINRLFQTDRSGHDTFHTMRVLRLSRVIAEAEHADGMIVSLAALLHDADDRKLFPETCADKLHARTFLGRHGIPDADIRKILRIIDEVSFNGTDSVIPSTIEGMCVQDADRLDALGAIGIARTFAYGGSHGRMIHDPAQPPHTGMSGAEYRSAGSTSINHFYEKLLLLKNMMNTETGRAIAAERDRFLREFLERFLQEWDGI